MVPSTVANYLDKHDAKWWSWHHNPTRSAQELAGELHVTGYRVAKSVVVDIDGQVWLAVLPATDRIDFERLAVELDADAARLVGELELTRLFPDCAPGAAPPFGGLFGLPVVVDRSLSFEDALLFNGGSHSDAIEMTFRQLWMIEHPRLATFSVPVWSEDYYM